jgi:hypothetical protein
MLGHPERVIFIVGISDLYPSESVIAIRRNR